MNLLKYLFVTIAVIASIIGSVLSRPDGMACLGLNGQIGGYGCVYRRVETGFFDRQPVNSDCGEKSKEIKNDEDNDEDTNDDYIYTK